MSPNKEQSGFTIIELMVALLIGLLLLAGIVSVFATSKRSYNTRDGMSVMQENGRVAIKRLQKGLSPAGYPMNQDIVPIVLDDGEYGVDASADGNAVPGDRITVVHRAGGTYPEDCLGSAGTVNGMIVNSFFVNAQNATLMCEGSGGQTQPLAEGVESMHVVYGMDADGDGYADHYLSATQVNGLSSDRLLSIVNIQVSLLVSSQQLARDTASAETYNLLGVNVVAANDMLQRRVFTTTIPLRNRIPLCEDCT